MVLSGTRSRYMKCSDEATNDTTSTTFAVEASPGMAKVVTL